jgi:hypothetical protein
VKYSFIFNWSWMRQDLSVSPQIKIERLRLGENGGRGSKTNWLRTHIVIWMFSLSWCGELTAEIYPRISYIFDILYIYTLIVFMWYIFLFHNFRYINVPCSLIEGQFWIANKIDIICLVNSYIPPCSNIFYAKQLIFRRRCQCCACTFFLSYF